MMYAITAPAYHLNPFVTTRLPNAVVLPGLSVARIKRVVADYYNVSVNEMNSARRNRQIARPRQVAMWLSKELTLKSLPHIGSLFNRDHTTVIHACKTIQRLMVTDGDLADDIRALKVALKVDMGMEALAA